MRVLVTGGAGYIGSHTISELMRHKNKITVLDSLELSQKPSLPEVAFYQGSTQDTNLLNRIFEECSPQAVMHFAAYKSSEESLSQPSKYFQNNVSGLLNLLDTMVRYQTRYMVFSSSCSIFGTPDQLPVAENAPARPESVYGETKLIGETLLKWYDQTMGIKFSALRYFNAAGAALDNTIGEDWRFANNLISVIMKVATGHIPSFTIFGSDYPTHDGTSIRDYIHVVDLAIAHVKALEQIIATNKSTTYNLGTGIGHSVLEVAEMTHRVSEVSFPITYSARRPGDPAAIWADCSKAERELGWKARYSLETILHSAWQWYHTHPDGYNNLEVEKINL